MRSEISQDVDRCLQENLFFQEPDTKLKLTDILFIYSKLNPDVGYRQGMHELLAPILWVVDRDSVQPGSEGSTEHKDESLMLELLDPQFVEHDSFTLFLSVMYMARMYYEHSETRSGNGQAEVIPIVSRCQYLHEEALAIIDNELAEHLQAIDVLPQIFLTRWMRLLFGREFQFDEVLLMWDLLFAHGLRSDLVDFTCIAMLLRIRWPLLKAGYSTALSLLLRYPSPQPYAPQSFVHDALYLEQNPTAERGSFIISRYSGRPPEFSKRRSHALLRPARKAHLWDQSGSPTRSPIRNTPKGLEVLLQDVSEGIQQRTKSWGVAKAVRGAVTEARRNMQTMHYEPGVRGPVAKPDGPSTLAPTVSSEKQTATPSGWETKVAHLEERNKALAITLREALNDLRSQLTTVKELDSDTTEAVQQALTRAESVQVCLEDPSIPMDTPPSTNVKHERGETVGSDTSQEPLDAAQDVPDGETASDSPHAPDPGADAARSAAEKGTETSVTTARLMKTDGPEEIVKAIPSGTTARPSLADAGFSWMLEGSRNVSSFISSASVPPEQTRHHDQPRGKPSPLFGGHGDEKLADAKHDEMALRSLGGTRGPL